MILRVLQGGRLLVLNGVLTPITLQMGDWGYLTPISGVITLTGLWTHFGSILYLPEFSEIASHKQKKHLFFPTFSERLRSPKPWEFQQTTPCDPWGRVDSADRKSSDFPHGRCSWMIQELGAEGMKKKRELRGNPGEILWDCF